MYNNTTLCFAESQRKTIGRFIELYHMCRIDGIIILAWKRIMDRLSVDGTQ